MTTTDPQTVSAFLTAITAEPDNDTPRLAFADYLEENGEVDRAEFIRIQVERERCGNPLYGANITCHLLGLHPEWSRLPCPECGGRGGIQGPREDTSYYFPLPCLACNRSGDLLKFRVPYESNPRGQLESRTVQFRRGFIDSVSCELAEVLGPEAERICRTCRNEGHVGRGRRLCPACAGGGGLGRLVAQPWAKAVLRACPTITRLVATDVHAGCTDLYAKELADLAREVARE